MNFKNYKNLGTFHLAMLALFLFGTSSRAIANKNSESFKGTAKYASGKIAYIETHQTVTSIETGKIISAETRYETQEKTLLATLKSDFTKSLTSPDHLFKNEVDGSVYGVRNEGPSIVMFKKEAADPKEEIKKLD